MNPITFILLDGSTTTKDVCVSVDGVDTTQFEKNPVMFYQHNDWNMPVGKWENVRKENGVGVGVRAEVYGGFLRVPAAAG